MHTCDEDDDSEDDKEADDGGDVLQQQAEEVEDLQEELSPDLTINDGQVAGLPIPTLVGSTDELNNSNPSSDDEMEQFSQQNHLHKPHRDPILITDQTSGMVTKTTAIDAATVRKHVKRTLMKKQKSQRRQPPPPQGANKKVRKQQSKRKQIPDYFEGF